MLAVAMCKALLVAMFFMHLHWEANWKYALTVPPLILGVILVVALVPDIGRRTQTYSQERARAAAEVTNPLLQTTPEQQLQGSNAAP